MPPLLLVPRPAESKARCMDRVLDMSCGKWKCVSPTELAQSLNNAGSSSAEFLVVDCRSLVAFNGLHIRGAIHVNCTGIGRKRLSQGKAKLKDLISSAEGKERFISGGVGTNFVIYDELSSGPEDCNPCRPICLVLQTLLKEGKNISLLKGKFCFIMLLCCLYRRFDSSEGNFWAPRFPMSTMNFGAQQFSNLTIFPILSGLAVLVSEAHFVVFSWYWRCYVPCKGTGTLCPFIQPWNSSRYVIQRYSVYGKNSVTQVRFFVRFLCTVKYRNSTHISFPVPWPGFVYMDRKWSYVGIFSARILAGTRNVLFVKSEIESSFCSLGIFFSFLLERCNGSIIKLKCHRILFIFNLLWRISWAAEVFCCDSQKLLNLKGLQRPSDFSVLLLCNAACRVCDKHLVKIFWYEWHSVQLSMDDIAWQLWKELILALTTMQKCVSAIFLPNSAHSS